MAFAFFLIVLFFAPLAFGTTELWSTVIAQFLAAMAVFCFSLPRFRNNRRKIVFYQIPGLIPLLLGLTWIYLQCLPLPVEVIRFISPQTVAIYQPVLDLLPPDTWIPVTINLHASIFEAFRCTVYILFYILTVQLLSLNKKLTATVTSIVWLTLFIAFVSMLQKAAAPHSLFFVRQMEHGLGSFGPWVYKNQYAGFMVMLCPLVLALFFLHRPIADPDESFRERLLHLFSGKGANLHLFFGFGVIVVMASVLLAKSRGGFLSLGFALVLFFILLARSQRKIQTWTLLFLFAGLVFAGGWFSWGAIMAKFGQAVDLTEGTIQNARLTIWQDAIKIVPDFLVTGTGFGTFIDIFPNYKSFADSLIYDHAHNDYLELLTDGGLIAYVFSAWFIVIILRNGWQKIFHRHERFAVFVAIGSLSGIAGLLFFSLTDFNLHNWANSLYFFLLCGLLVSAGHTRQHYRKHPTLLSSVASPGKARIALCCSTVIFLLAMLRLQGGELLAARYYSQARAISDSPTFDLQEQLPVMNKLLEEARKKAPLSSSYCYAMANLKQYEEKPQETFQLYLEAARLQPMEGTFLQALGLELAKKDVDKGRQLIQIGYARSRLKEGALNTWLDFEMSRRNWTETFRILRQELQRDPRLLKSIFPLLTGHDFSKEEIATVLPKITSAWITAANLSKAAGKKEDEGYFLEQALRFIEHEEHVKPQYFMRLFWYYRNLKEQDKAAEVLQQGIQYLPEYVRFHIYLGDYYKGKGIGYRAIEEYKQALLIQPGNTGIRKKIQQIEETQ